MKTEDQNRKGKCGIRSTLDTLIAKEDRTAFVGEVLALQKEYEKRFEHILSIYFLKNMLRQGKVGNLAIDFEVEEVGQKA